MYRLSELIEALNNELERLNSNEQTIKFLKEHKRQYRLAGGLYEEDLETLRKTSQEPYIVKPTRRQDKRQEKQTSFTSDELRERMRERERERERERYEAIKEEVRKHGIL